MTAPPIYIFGPVPSRRLGLSLGVDTVPYKVCTLDCVYCQVGSTTEKTVERKEYIPIEPVIEQLKARLAEGVKPDFITISGSGEPTLNSRLGDLIDAIKKITDIPVAILTNGTLLYRPDVRVDCAKADVVLPSLDAGDQQCFQRINRPHKEISLQKLIDGLVAFRKEFTGQIWLEIFFIDGYNTDPEQVTKIKQAIARIDPDKVHLNTAVRPTAEPGIEKLSPQKLAFLARQLGPKAEVIADFKAASPPRHIDRSAENVLSMLKRRPCSLADICAGLSLPSDQALTLLRVLEKQALIAREDKGGITFFKTS